jgi:hypothetical protein
MKFAIEIQDMSQAELAAVTAFLTGMGAKPTGMSKTIAELAAATGAAPAETPAPMVAPTPGPAFNAPVGIPAPAPAPAPQVVTDPFSAPPPAGANGELDVRGVPHNPTFHAETKRKNGDGSWAKRKGVDKDGCARYEAQFIGARPTIMTPPTAAPTTPAPSAAETTAKFAPHLVTPPAAAPSPTGDPFAAPAAAPSVPPVTNTPPAPPTPALEEVTYNQWYELYMNLLTAGKITPEQYTTIAERYGAIENTMKFMDDAQARAASYADMMVLTR